jgi:hypothetical protein
LNESKELKKELDAFYDAGNKKIIVPAKKMLKIAAADVRSRGSVAWGGKKARNVARFA